MKMSENPRKAHVRQGQVEASSGTIDSMPSFGMGESASDLTVAIKDWSAQDFANIYVRFRPHLISHARRFLRQEYLAEEVVQDAFLYLMTALPELDSELGVLRFLKWKTKMLCLDIIRSSNSGLNGSMLPLTEDVPEESKLEISLERADDAAIIRMALAKLSSRHREALIATLYEEKSHEEVARQMGIGENAFRQLLFRARAAFRKSLVGEAEIEGKTTAQILAIASRKQSLRAIVAGSMSLIVLVLGIVPFSQEDNTNLPTLSAQSRGGSAGDTVSAPETRGADAATSQRKPEQVISQTPANLGLELDPLQGDAEFRTDLASRPSETFSGDLETVDKDGSLSPDSIDLATDTLNRVVMASRLDSDVISNLPQQTSDLNFITGEDSLTIVSESGFEAYLVVTEDEANLIPFANFIFTFGELKFMAVPGTTMTVIDQTSDGSEVTFAATDLIIGDFAGEFGWVTVEKAALARSGFLVTLVRDHDAKIVDVAFELVQRS